MNFEKEMMGDMNQLNLLKLLASGTLETDSKGQNLQSPLQAGKAAKGQAAQTHRAGDWVCIKCNNLNYSFRNKCNRCQVQSKKQNLLDNLLLINSEHDLANGCDFNSKLGNTGGNPLMMASNENSLRGSALMLGHMPKPFSMGQENIVPGGFTGAPPGLVPIMQNGNKGLAGPMLQLLGGVSLTQQACNTAQTPTLPPKRVPFGDITNYVDQSKSLGAGILGEKLQKDPDNQDFSIQKQQIESLQSQSDSLGKAPSSGKWRELNKSSSSWTPFSNSSKIQRKVSSSNSGTEYASDKYGDNLPDVTPFDEALAREDNPETPKKKSKAPWSLLEQGPGERSSVDVKDFTKYLFDSERKEREAAIANAPPVAPFSLGPNTNMLSVLLGLFPDAAATGAHSDTQPAAGQKQPSALSVHLNSIN